MTRISIDPSLCMGTAFCSRIAPELFRLDETELISYVRIDVVPPELEEAAREAANACPASAIEVSDE